MKRSSARSALWRSLSLAAAPRDDAPAVDPWPTALAINLGLLSLFAVQHSVMARQGFKRWVTRLLPDAEADPDAEAEAGGVANGSSEALSASPARRSETGAS